MHNLFHDWVSKNLTFSKDIVLELEMIDKDENLHAASITFSDFSNLQFKDHQPPHIIVAEDFETIVKLTINRWLQGGSEVSSRTKIEFIGANDFTDSHVGVLCFNCTTIHISIDNKTYGTNEELERVINSFN